ncbi:MAG: YIP1 family protein [Clostridia bacterium]|nr:YIP1 family protein [Clostridia bacterium]
MKKFLSILCLIFALVMVMAPAVSAAAPYQTYTYSINGFALYSPDAYVPIMNIDSDYMGLGRSLGSIKDMVTDDDGNVYLIDAANNELIVLDSYYKKKFTVSNFVNGQGVPDGFTNPQGLYVTKDRIFVCDTDASRIVTFDKNGRFLDVIPQPESNLFSEGAVYKPIALAVDQYDRLYVVSSTTYQGIIVMTDEGQFTQFIGAQKVVASLWQLIWRTFQTDQQKALSQSFISTEFNNISITDDGFIYVTTQSLDLNQQQNAVKNKDKSGDFAPVKMLNASGAEIMRRNGFYPPSGEVDVSNLSTDTIVGPSTITDVAVGPEKTWSIVDRKRSKVFTYDFDGNLLFAFGDYGTMLGNISIIQSICYQDDIILILDGVNNTITTYKRTEYGDALIQALYYQNARQYDAAIDSWIEILKRNSNFDTAYIGIGQSLFRQGKYEEAIDYYQSAYDTANYSSAYKELRKEWISKYLFVLLGAVVVVIILCSKFMKYAKKVNYKTSITAGKRTLKQELLFVFHLIFHPFDGFWDLKHEKRGSVRASLIIIGITILSFYYQSIGQGYIMNPEGVYSSILVQFASVLAPLFLWVVGNWCLTTLFEGEGSFKDIFIACSYSLAPLPLMVIPSTIFSNVITDSETAIVSLLVTVGYIWLGLLIFVGMMVTHDYSLSKNVLTALGTIVAMAFIMFLAILFTTLLGKVVSFVTNIVDEISFRM